MKEQNESLVDKKMQYALCVLISQRYMIYQTCLQSVFAAGAAQNGAVGSLLGRIAGEELKIHIKDLVEWCMTYGCEIPAMEREFKKYAGAAFTRPLAQLKKNQPATYYFQLMHQILDAGMKSIMETFDEFDVCEFTDLQSTLWRIYYDEDRNVKDLATAVIAYQAGDDLIMA